MRITWLCTNARGEMARDQVAIEMMEIDTNFDSECTVASSQKITVRL